MLVRKLQCWALVVWVGTMKMSLEGLWVPTCFSRGLVARKPLFCSSDLSPPKKKVPMRKLIAFVLLLLSFLIDRPFFVEQVIILDLFSLRFFCLQYFSIMAAFPVCVFFLLSLRYVTSFYAHPSQAFFASSPPPQASLGKT